MGTKIKDQYTVLVTFEKVFKSPTGQIDDIVHRKTQIFKCTDLSEINQVFPRLVAVTILESPNVK